MKETLKNVSEIIAGANDVFTAKFDSIGTLMGIIDKALRKQGLNSDAITIDCVSVNKKIVILLDDDKPDSVDIALGNKDGDIFSSSQLALSDINETLIVEIMEDYFIA